MNLSRASHRRVRLPRHLQKKQAYILVRSDLSGCAPAPEPDTARGGCELDTRAVVTIARFVSRRLKLPDGRPGQCAEFKLLAPGARKGRAPFESPKALYVPLVTIDERLYFEDQWAVYKLLDGRPAPTYKQILLQIAERRAKRRLADPTSWVGRRAALRRAGFPVS